MGVSYLTYLCPGLHWRDAGELSAAAYSLGVAHPTGFPLYLLVAKLFSFVPLGSVAFRVNLVSAVSAAIAVGFCYRIVLRLSVRSGWAEHGAAAAAALLLGSGTTLWLHATTAEIYALNLMVVTWLLWWVIQWTVDGVQRRLFGLAIITGLGLGLHITFVMVAGVCWLFVLIGLRDKNRAGALGRSVGSIAFWLTMLAVLAAAVVLYLPIRAGQDPWVNWGNITSLNSLWEHLSGGRIRQAYSADMGAFSRWDSNLTMAMQQLFSQCGWGVLLSLFGVVVLLRRLRSIAALLVVLWVSDVLFSSWINPMGMEDRQTGLITTLCTVIFLGVAGASVGRWMVREMREWGAAAAIFVAVVGLCSPAMLAEPHRRNLRDLYQAADMADIVFEQLPADALLLVTSDDLAGASLYAQGVEGQRPDVTTVVKQHILDRAYLAHVDRWGSGVHLKDDMLVGEMTDPNAALKRLTDDNSERAIFWELGDPVLDNPVRLRLRVDLPVARFGTYKFVGYQHVCIDIRRRWRRLSYGMLPESARHLLARLYSVMTVHGIEAGRTLASQGKKKQARDWILFAANTSSSALQTLDVDGSIVGKTACDRIESPAPNVLTNYAVAMHHLADLFQGEDAPQLNLEAERCFRRVAALHPGDVGSWVNLGKARFRLGPEHYSTARAAFTEAALLEVGPKDQAQIDYFGAIMDANDGHLRVALDRLESVIPVLIGSQRREALSIRAEINRLLTSRPAASE